MDTAELQYLVKDLIRSVASVGHLRVLEANLELRTSGREWSRTLELEPVGGNGLGRLS